MPRGIYDRSARKSAVAEPGIPVIQQNPGNPGDYRVNKVQVNEMPDRQSANSNVEIIRQTHGDETVSTTERLFGDMDLTKEEVGVEQQPLKPVEPLPQNPDEAEQPKFAAAAQAEEEAKSDGSEPKPVDSKPEASEEFIDWEKMAGKKIRQKIDGKEVIVTAEELKGYSDQDQIKKHLAEAANKVGEERRRLAEERKQIQELRQQRQEPIQNGIEAVPQTEFYQRPNMDDNPVLRRIQFLESQVQQLAQGTQPVIYETNRQRVANELKAQGFNDFMEYLPKMEMHMVTIQDPQLAGFYDTPQGAKSLYFQLKAQDMLKTPQAKQVAPDVSRRTQTNPIPPATQIDGGAQPSGSFNDDSGHNYRQAFRRATNLGDDKEAWNEVLRQKGILPEG